MEPKVEFEIEICRICKCALSYNTVNIGQKGLNKLISVSAIRKDGLFSENDYTATNLRLHAQCRKNYTKDSSIATAVKKQEVNSTSVFLETSDAPMQDLHLIDYEDQCLFCAEDASEVFIFNQKRKVINKRIIVNKISKNETRESILQSSFRHDDRWSNEVRERIQGVDLVSLNARYHKPCFIKFMSLKRPTSNKRGRPECTQILEQMEQVYKFIESNNFNDRQFSIQDIQDALPVDLPSERTIRHKLVEHYGDKLSVLESKGKPLIFCFAKASQKILHDQYMERHSYPETDRENIVLAAANIILEDIRLRADEAKPHPTPTHFWQDIKHVVPDTLDIFLKIVITNNKQDANDYDRKITALAHTIVSAARPRSFRSPLLLGISSMIHQKYPSKTLIDLLSSLGFCESHSEVNKFGNSTISHPPCQQQTEANSESNREVNKFGNSITSYPPFQHPLEADWESCGEDNKFGNSTISHSSCPQETEADCESHREDNKYGNSTISHSPCPQQTKADCESHSEVNKFGISTTSHPPCQQKTEAEVSTQYVSDNADVKLIFNVVPKEMLELISCKCKKSSRRNCSDDNCCNKFNKTVPYEEVEVFIKEEKIENGMDPLERLENARTDKDVKAINKYEYNDRNEEEKQNVCTVNFSKKRRT